MRDTLNNEQCLKIIAAEVFVRPQTNAKHSSFLTKEERNSHILSLYEKWQKNNN